MGPLVAHQTGRPPAAIAKQIGEILERGRFNVVHFHNISLFGPGVLEIRPSNGPLKLYTAHDHWLICPLSVLWKNGSKACDGPTCVRCTIRAGRPPQWWRYSKLLDEAAKHVDLFLAPSRFSVEFHWSRGLRHPMRDLADFLPEPDPKATVEKPNSRPYALFVGRLEPYKGVQEAIKAVSPDSPFDLLVVGSGTYEAELRRRAAGNPRIRFAGWVSQTEIDSYYRNALAVVVPSLTYETFGIVAIEAAARSAPVVANRLGPLPEIVADGGLTYATIPELQRHLRQIAEDDSLRARLGAAGRRRYELYWTPDAHLQRYFELIEEARRIPLKSRAT